MGWKLFNGLAAFTEAELEAIDELEEYLKRRNDLTEKHNDDLADKQAQQAKEIQQLEEDHAWRLAKIMGWEEGWEKRILRFAG